MALIAISVKKSWIWQAYIFLCVFSFQAWKSWCVIAWMRYWFCQLHSQGDGDCFFPGPPYLKGRHNLGMQFHLNVMACLLCTNVSPDSSNGAENQKGFSWISIKQIHLSQGEHLWLCWRLSVQLVFSIKDKREILFCNCFWCCCHKPPLAIKFLEGDVELGI